VGGAVREVLRGEQLVCYGVEWPYRAVETGAVSTDKHFSIVADYLTTSELVHIPNNERASQKEGCW